MLEQFKLKEQDTVRVEEAPLRSTVTAIFQKMSVPDEDARIAADVLVSADLRGVDTHGVSNLLRQYVQRYREGALNPVPKSASSGSPFPPPPSTPTMGWASSPPPRPWTSPSPRPGRPVSAW